MADPVTILTPSGPFLIAQATVLWMREKIGSDAGLGKTHKALGDSLSGVPIALPDAERAEFCDKFRAILTGMSPSELSSLQPQEAERLLSAVCG
jgi:hypothetical protein